MKNFKENLEQRIKELRSVIQKKEKSLADAPEGTIHLFESTDRKQFYYKAGHGETKRKYIKKNNRQTISALCQKDYDQKVLDAAKKELKQLEKLEIQYPALVYEEVYDALAAGRKEYVKPIRSTDEDFVKKWERIEYNPKMFHDDAPEFFTEKGERVRSKTEILIANALKKHGVPYHYEKPLDLNQGFLIHPDFTILNIRLRKEYYWEHMGIMDDPHYLEKALQRITQYERKGLFPGTELILTYETIKNPISSRTIDDLIEHYLL